MPEERLIFTPVIEGLYHHGLKGRVTPELKERLRGLGLDLDSPLPSAFPVRIWARCLQVTAEELFPSGSREESLWRLGLAHVEGYRSTLIGRATMALMRVLGPQRFLRQLTRSFRTMDNYSETRLEELGPGRVRLWSNANIDVVAYTEGVFVGFLVQTGAREPHAVVLERTEQGTVFELTWRV